MSQYNSSPLVPRVVLRKPRTLSQTELISVQLDDPPYVAMTEFPLQEGCNFGVLDDTCVRPGRYTQLQSTNPSFSEQSRRRIINKLVHTPSRSHSQSRRPRSPPPPSTFSEPGAAALPVGEMGPAEALESDVEQTMETAGIETPSWVPARPSRQQAYMVNETANTVPTGETRVFQNAPSQSHTASADIFESPKWREAETVDSELSSVGPDPPPFSHQSSMRPDTAGSVVSFHDIFYEVDVKKMPWSKAVKKEILKGVSGIMRPGLNAIMGGTGSGKSSLLDVLAGRKDPQFLKGKVLINGRTQPKNFKCMSGYVVQDDIVMGTLTVRENLYFSAALRLPKSQKHKHDKVNEVLEELSLQHVADSKIGTEFYRGVSGGERKRTNIGMELITDPKVLFLDEPTTGLDAFTAGQVIKSLKRLSRRGRTIVMALHQPKYSIYKLFDTLTLVSKGNLIYHGRAGNHPLTYFAKLGYECEKHDNPSDFYMDIAYGEIKPNSASSSQEEGADPEPVNVGTLDSLKHDHAAYLNEVVATLTNSWAESDIAKETNEDLKRIMDEHQTLERGTKDGHHRKEKNASDVSFATSFCTQLRWVCWRTGLNLLRDPNASIVQTIVYLFFAISMGVVYFNLDTSIESGIQNRAGLFFFSALQVIFVNLGSVEVFIKERVNFIQENSSGYYRVSSYFLAKIACDILPTKALPLLVFFPITYFMVHLRRDAGAFFFFELILMMTTMGAAGVALLVSATVSMNSIGTVITSITYVFMMVFGGYLINLNSMGVWLSWLRYLSIFRYCWSGLLVNEMPTLVFTPMTNQTSNGTTDIRLPQPGWQYLEDVGIPWGTPWDLWVNFFGLLMLFFFFYAIAYVQLRRINKYK